MWRIARRLLPAPWHGFGLFLVACLPADYGAAFIFSYGEPFLTARLPAEALGLWAVALSLERRHVAALALAGVATATHPLIGSVCVATVALGATPRVRWWPVCLLALAAFVLVQCLPFAALHPFDPEWRAVARFNVPFLFPSLWDLTAWSKACWAVALPAVLYATGDGARRPFWSNLTLVGVAGLGVATIADLAGRDAMWGSRR